MEVNTDQCLFWARSKNLKGYGRIQVKEKGIWRNRQAHRVLYEAEYGELPQDLVLDHLCRNTSCINLEHLEPVTNKENIRRGIFKCQKSLTHCNNGHERNPKNTYTNKKGQHRCYPCMLMWRKDNYHKNYYPGKYSKKS